MSANEGKRLLDEQPMIVERVIEQAGFTRRMLRKAPPPHGGTAEEVELRKRLNRSKVAADGALTIEQVRAALGGEGALLVATIGLCYPRQAYIGPPGAAAANALIINSGEWRSMSPRARQDCVATAIWEVGRKRLHADINEGKRSRGLLELAARRMNELYWLRALTDKDIASRVITRLRDEMFSDRRRWPKGNKKATMSRTGVNGRPPTMRSKQSKLVAAAVRAADDLRPKSLKNRDRAAAAYLRGKRASQLRRDAMRRKMAVVRRDSVLAALLDYLDQGMTQGLTTAQAKAEARRRLVKDLNICQKTITRHLKDAKKRLDQVS